MEGRQSQQNDQRHDVAGVPEAVPRPEGESAAPAAPAPAPAPAPARTYQPKPVPAQAAARATGAGQFTTAAEAQARCPSDKVVWVNTKSHIYHYAGTHSYGTTKRGAYMCEADASAAGDRASKAGSIGPSSSPKAEARQGEPLPKSARRLRDLRSAQGSEAQPEPLYRFGGCWGAWGETIRICRKRGIPENCHNFRWILA